MMNPVRSLHNLLLSARLQKLQYQPQVSKGSNVAILFAADSLRHREAAQHFATVLRDQRNLKPYLCAYVDKKLAPSVSFGYAHYSRSDIGLLGVPSSKKLDLFLRRPYFAVVNLDKANYPSLHYVCHQIPAQHKLCINHFYPHLYDIVVEDGPAQDIRESVDKTLDIFAKIVLK